MYETEPLARAKFQQLVDDYGNIGKRLGDHLARVDLVPAHGFQTDPSGDFRHFDVHEYTGVDLTLASVMIGPLL